MIVAAVVIASVFGFSLGLFAFRVKSRWCPVCGATTVALGELRRSPAPEMDKERPQAGGHAVNVPTRVGDLIHLSEQDYRFGVGGLSLRVTTPPVLSDDPEWITVHGIEIAWNGERAGERQVLVRARALRDPRTYTVP